MEKLDLWFAPSRAFVVPPHPKAGAINEEKLLTFGSPWAVSLSVVLSGRNLLGLNSKGGFLNLRVRGGR